MPAKKVAAEPKRGRTVPIFDDRYAWWTIAVRRQMAIEGLDGEQLAERLGVAASQVSRCINRRMPVYDLLVAISDELKVAYPVILPETEEEAIGLAEERRVLRRLAQARAIKAGVAEIPKEDQTQPVASEHAIRPPKAEGKKTSKQAQRPHLGR